MFVINAITCTRLLRSLTLQMILAREAQPPSQRTRLVPTINVHSTSKRTVSTLYTTNTTQRSCNYDTVLTDVLKCLKSYKLIKNNQ